MEGNLGIYINIGVAIVSGICAIVYWLGGIFDDDPKDFAKCGISEGICILSIVFLIVGICMCEKQSWELPDSPYQTVQIVALNDNNMTNGRFYVRRGYISEDLYYQYMKKEGLGFKAGKVKADKTTLYYDDENYRVECYEKTKKWLYFETSEYYYKIYIPEGSIAEDYSVDLE